MEEEIKKEPISELETTRFIGTMIFKDGDTEETCQRKKMFYYDNVKDYCEIVHKEFVEYGRTTLVNLYDIDYNSVIILMDFRDFQNKHDKYIESIKRESIRPHLAKN